MEYDLPDGAVIRIEEESLVACLEARINGKSHPCSKLISEVDVFDHEPRQLPALSKLGMNNGEWYFFYSRQRLYKNGEVWKRKTNEGNWHETGDRKEKVNIATRRIFVFKIKRKSTEYRLYEYEIGEGSNLLVGSLKKTTTKNGKRKRTSSNAELQGGLAPNPDDHILNTEVLPMNNSVKRNKTSGVYECNDNQASSSEVDAACSELQKEPPPLHMQTSGGDYAIDYCSCGGSTVNCSESEVYDYTMEDGNNFEAYSLGITNENSPSQQTLSKILTEQGASVIDNSNNKNMPQYPNCDTTENVTPPDSSGEEISGLYLMPLYSPQQADTTHHFNYSEFNPNDWPFNFSSDAEDGGNLKLGEPTYFDKTESRKNKTTSELLNDTRVMQSLGIGSDVNLPWIENPSVAIGGLSSNST